jgi:hypothetical protein
VQWNLRHEGAKQLANAKIDAGDPDSGPIALPGKYTLKLSANGQSFTTEGEIVADPRSPVSADQLRQNHEFSLQARAALDKVNDHIDAIRAIRAQTADLKARTEKLGKAMELRETAAAILQRCDAIEGRLHNPEAQVVYDVLRGHAGGAKLYSQLAPLFSDIQSSDYAPTQGQREQLQENLAELTAIEGEITALRNGDLARLEARVSSLGLPRIIVPQASKP